MKILLVLLFSSLSCLAQTNFGVFLFTNQVEIAPNGWPREIRPLGTNTGPLLEGEVLLSAAELDATYANLLPAKDLITSSNDLSTKVGLSRTLVLNESQTKTFTILFKAFMQTIFPTLNLSRTNHGTNALTQNQWLAAFQLNVSNLIMSDITTNNP